VNAIDDFYGKHKYGYQTKEGTYNAEEFEKRYDRVDVDKIKEVSDDVCDKHQQPDCMKCWYTTKAEGKIDDTFVTDMKHIHMLRQMINEMDRSKLITTEDIITFLKLQ
jgi:hypothetical protein